MSVALWSAVAVVWVWVAVVTWQTARRIRRVRRELDVLRARIERGESNHTGEP